MKFIAEDGSEWTSDPMIGSHECIAIVRVPKKSELWHWVEKVGLSAHDKDGMHAGFRKAIEIAEKACHSSPFFDGFQAAKNQHVYEALKKFAGIKE